MSALILGSSAVSTPRADSRRRIVSYAVTPGSSTMPSVPRDSMVTPSGNGPGSVNSLSAVPSV
jgi:hypothetical protein